MFGFTFLSGLLRINRMVEPRVYNPEIRNPRLMGARAYHAGVSRRHCPFSPDSGQWRRWMAGYTDALWKSIKK